jgi:YspA, cpYpsA-related SLOG family
MDEETEGRVRVIVCGSRRWTDRKRIEDRLFDLVTDNPGEQITIVHGDAANGADKIADQEAMKAGLLIERHPADWSEYGKRAGFVRNAEMAQAGADLCIAFWDGRSSGTAHMMECAESAGIPVEVIV